MRFSGWARAIVGRYLQPSHLDERRIARNDWDLLAFEALFQAHEDGRLTESDRCTAIEFVNLGAFDRKSGRALLRYVLTPTGPTATT